MAGSGGGCHWAEKPDRLLSVWGRRTTFPKPTSRLKVYKGAGCTSAMQREFQFADQDSSHSDASSEVVNWEGPQYLESRHPARETVRTWMSAMLHTP